MRYLDRTAINIVLTTAGSLVAVSGIFMLFHYESQFTKVLHEIGGVILVVFAILHVIINRKALFNSVKGKMRYCLIIIAACTAVMIFTGDPEFEKNELLEHLEELQTGLLRR